MGPIAGVPNQKCADYTLLSEEVQDTHRKPRGSSLESELPLWASETNRVCLTKNVVSTCLHKESRVIRFLRDPRNSEWGEGCYPMS